MRFQRIIVAKQRAFVVEKRPLRGHFMRMSTDFAAITPGAVSDLADGASHGGEFYRRVLESLSEGVLITDAQWRILYANRLIQETTGYSPEELVGRSPHDMLMAVHGSGASECAKQNPLAETEQCIELEIKTKSGEPRWILIKTTPFRDAAGQVVGSVAALMCIDKLKTLERENEILLADVRESFGHIVGESLPLKKVLSQIATVAPTEAGVLVLGESGTGKELVAHAVHELSPRKARPLVRVNCASIPKELFESEFFGHVRGAFTGAIKDRTGRFELADGGTLFLDEVGEIPLELQGKLLRVLQEGQFERVGDERTRRVNVRIIAASNRDLQAEAKAGRFRLDLYYRLSVFPIDLPPLRERLEDIEPLAVHFIRKAARRLGVPLPRLTKAHAQQLRSYDWPGNIRELQNVIERAVILARGGRLRFELPQGSAGRPPAIATAGEPEPAAGETLSLDGLESKKRAIVEAALARAKGKIYGADGAAALLGMKPTTLSSMIKRQNLARGTT
jgi:formate hydrogenlyase transcriptional activator